MKVMDQSKSKAHQVEQPVSPSGQTMFPGKPKHGMKIVPLSHGCLPATGIQAYCLLKPAKSETLPHRVAVNCTGRNNPKTKSTI